MSTDHKFWRERRAEAELNQDPSVYQPNILLLGQTNSQLQLSSVRIYINTPPVVDGFYKFCVNLFFFNLIEVQAWCQSCVKAILVIEYWKVFFRVLESLNMQSGSDNTDICVRTPKDKPGSVIIYRQFPWHKQKFVHVQSCRPLALGHRPISMYHMVADLNQSQAWNVAIFSSD